MTNASTQSTGTTTSRSNDTLAATANATNPSPARQKTDVEFVLISLLIVFLLGLLLFVMLRRFYKREIDACVGCMHDAREEIQEAGVKLRRRVSTLGSRRAPRSAPNQGVALRESSDSDGEESAYNPYVDASSGNNPENSSGNEHSAAPADAPESVLVCAMVSASGNEEEVASSMGH